MVITSLDEAREMEKENEAVEGSHPAPAQKEQRLLLVERIAAARQALDALERDCAQAVPLPATEPVGTASSARGLPGPPGSPPDRHDGCSY
ncbi:hypothetical protein ACNPQM_42090 [Streptomyces sp. NPDC056231]|uniref:hypothetical protein n=1 Tax=Streptomyces sp. NPDC056231 TaxID=3345755 RepID=UPI003AACBD65